MKVDEFYTAKALSELLSCHVKTINKLCRDEKLKAHKKLGRWIILHSDFLEWIKS